jgi:serine/threonine protein kinase
MSPEQANAGELDRRTDVYALGVVLWEMVTSRRLFRADNEIRLLDMVRNPQIPKPSEHGPVPEGLEDVILDALRPDVRVRLPTAKALRDRLLQAQPGAGHVHSSNLAGLLATVLGDKIEESPISWSEAFSVEQAHATASHLANHTMAASASLFSDELEEDDEPMPRPTAAQVPRRRVTTAPPPPPSAPRPPPPRPRVPTPVPTPSHSRPVLRPSATPPPSPDRPNTFAQFSQPPPPDAPVPVPVEVKPPSSGAQLLVSLVSLVVLGGALALAGYLLWQAGAFEELLNETSDAAVPATDGALPAPDAGL